MPCGSVPSVEVCAALAPGSGEVEGVIGADLEDAIAALLGSLSFDHGDQCAIVDAIDECVIVRVGVALEDGVDLVGAFKDLADGVGVADGVRAVRVEALMDEHEHWFVGVREVLPQPLDLLGRYGGILPVEVISSVGSSV